MQNKKGFTIIELIVVIAIIAILAATVLVSMSGYINKAKDSSMKQEAHNLLVDATSYAFSSASTDYGDAVTGGVCSTNNNYLAIKENDASVVCGASTDGDTFCICFQKLAPVDSGTPEYYCQDSSGITTEQKTNACSAECIISTGDDALCVSGQ